MDELRFESAPEEAYEILKQCIEDHFPDLKDASILILFDRKKRESGGATVLARIRKTNDLIKKLTIDNGSYDYIIYFDKLLWSLIDEKDKVRLMRHELRHARVKPGDDGPEFGIIGAHGIEDFEPEVELNQDDPDWKKRIAGVLMDKYEELKTKQRKLFN